MDILNPPFKIGVKPLQKICLKFIVKQFCHLKPYLKNEFLFDGLADDFILKLCKSRQLTPDILPYIDPEFMQLSAPTFVGIPKNGIDDFSFLSKFHLRCLSIVSIDSVSPKYILGCLNTKSILSIVHLNLCRFKIREVERDLHRVRASIITPFLNLQSLTVSGMNFNNDDLQELSTQLPTLLYLDISNTKVNSIKSIRNFTNLRGLYMYFKHNHCETFATIDIVMELSSLIELDISINPIDGYNCDNKVLYDFVDSSSNPNLEFLNISGLGYIFSLSIIKKYLANHPKLSSLAASSMFIDAESDLQEFETLCSIYPDVNIICNVGNSLLKVLETFRSRPHYIKDALHALFRETSGSPFVARPETLRIVLKTVQSFEFKLALQQESRQFRTDILMVFTAALYNLISKCSKNMPIHLTQQALSLVIDTLDSPYTNSVVQKNALLCICNDVILTSIKFEHKRCCDLIFKCFNSGSSDQYIMQLGLCIISSLAAEMTLQEVSDLSVNIDCLLLIVAERGLTNQDTDDIPWLKSKIPGTNDFSTADLIMGFSLGALWNLTDECEAGCKKFIEFQGLDIYYKLFRNYSVNEDVSRQVFTKCLGLLNNFAEVPSLRKDLLSHKKLMSLFLDLLHQSSVTVRYFAAGIISHLVCEPQSEWLKYFGTSKQHYDDTLYNALVTWELANDDMVAYRSFKPFESLIQHPESTRGVWLWALWAIRHVVNLKEDRYVPCLLNCPHLMKFIEKHAHVKNNQQSDQLNHIARFLWNQKIHTYLPNLMEIID